MDYLRVHYDEATVEHADDTAFLTALQSSRYVYESWYAINDQTPAYQCAILLHPSYRAAYVEYHWPRDWVEDAKRAARSLYKTQYYTPPPPPQAQPELHYQVKRDFKDWKQSIALFKKVTDEFDELYHGIVLRSPFNTLKWLSVSRAGRSTRSSMNYQSMMLNWMLNTSILMTSVATTR